MLHLQGETDQTRNSRVLTQPLSVMDRPEGESLIGRKLNTTNKLI